MEHYIKEFKDLNPYEVFDILALRAEIFVVEQNCPYQDPDHKDKSSYHLIYKAGDKVAAYLRIIPRGISYEEVSIGRVVVHKDFRHEALGTKMLKEALKFIKDNLDENTVRISAQAHLQGFYGDIGFKTVSEEYLEDDIPHVEMLLK